MLRAREERRRDRGTADQGRTQGGRSLESRLEEPGQGLRGRVRDAVMRTLTARSWRAGLRQRAAARESIGLPVEGGEPLRRLIATLPAVEVPRPDWPP